MTKDNDVALVVKEVSPLVETAQNLKIINADTMSASVELLSECNKRLDTIIEKEETITAPAKLIIKTEQARWKFAKETLKTAIDFLRGEQSRYMTQETRRAKEEEVKIAARVGEGKGHLKIETAVKQLSEIDKPEQKVITSAGSVKFREIQKLKIVDQSLIPRMFLAPDEQLITMALKNGETVAGCELETLSIPVNTR